MKIYERSNIDLLLSEQQFQISGNVNDETAKNIGQLIGVDYVCYGDIIDFDSKVSISGRLVNVETGEVASVGIVSIPMTNEIQQLFYPETISKNQKVSILNEDNNYMYKSVLKLGYGYGLSNSKVFKLAYTHSLPKIFYLTGDFTYSEVGYEDEYETHVGVMGGLLGIGVQTGTNRRFQLFSTLYLGYGLQRSWTDVIDWNNDNHEEQDSYKLLLKADSGVICHLGDTWLLGIDAEIGPLDLLCNLFLGFKFH